MDTIDISTFAGAEQVGHKGVSCWGDPAEFRSIVERSIAFARKYSDTLGSGDLAGAYALAGASLRKRMSFEKYASTNERKLSFTGPLWNT